jgi:hypothetical protein
MPVMPGRMRPVFGPGPSIVGMGDIFGDIGNAFSGAVSSVVSVVPGLSDLVNGPLKDFANTTAGAFVLNVIADNFAIATVSKLGPAIAAMWAIPGVARGDSFDKALIEGTSKRLQQTAAILGVDVGPVITSQLTGLASQLADEYGVGQVLPSLEDIAAQYGVREDVAAIAKAELEHLPMPNLDLFDAATGRYLLGVGITPVELSKLNQEPEFRILAAAQALADETSVATSTAQINAFHALTDPTYGAAPAAAAPVAVVAAVAPPAAAPAAGMSTAEKIGVVTGVAGLAATLALVLIK